MTLMKCVKNKGVQPEIRYAIQEVHCDVSNVFWSLINLKRYISTLNMLCNPFQQLSPLPDGATQNTRDKKMKTVFEWWRRNRDIAPKYARVLSQCFESMLSV